MRIPVPHVSHHVVALRGEFARLVHTHLYVLLVAYGTVRPFQVGAVNVHHHISVGSAIAVERTCPPSSAGCCNIVLIESGCHLHVLEEVGVSGKDVCLVGGENFCQSVGIQNVVDGLHLVPCRCVHVQNHHHVLRHIAQVALQPLQLGIGKLLLILASATIVDVLHRDDVASAYVERVVDRSEIFAEHLFGILLHARFGIVQVGVALVEVVVANALEESHASAFDRVDILRIKRHVVEHHVA